MFEDKKPLIEIPPGAVAAPKKEPVIHVMPKEFRGVKIIPRPPASAVPPAPPQPPSFPTPPAPGAPPKPPAPRKKFPLMPVIAAGGIILVIGGIAAYTILTTKPRQVTRPPVAPPVNKAPTVNVNAPPAAANENVNAPPPPQVNENVNAPFPTAAPQLGKDTDGDGLSDAEELLYQTNSTKPDTDEDSYIDGHEVFHLYNPAGVAPERLLDAGLVKKYKNQPFGYEFLYPSSWEIKEQEAGGRVVLSSPSGEFFQVITEDNAERLPLVAWYLNQSPGVSASQVEAFVSKSRLDGIKSPDRLTAYLTSDARIFIISYALAGKLDINYNRTFEMLINSFRIESLK